MLHIFNKVESHISLILSFFIIKIKNVMLILKLYNFYTFGLELVLTTPGVTVDMAQ